VTGRAAESTATADAGARNAERVRREVRLRMKPHTGTRGSVDGAGWPRSHNPVAEFPGLALAMSSWVSPVRRVTYQLDDWDTTGRELTVEGWSVGLVGFPSIVANTVVVTGSTQCRIMLLVSPPGTPGRTAQAVLRSAAGPDTVAGVEEILASNGVLVGQAR
jgi:uncharacterized protein DUF5994